MANTTLNTIDVVTNSFQNWLDKTNAAINVLINQAVTVTNTAGGDSVSGNGSVTGTLAATTLAATTLRGGTITAAANLAISTNTNITAAYVNVTANTLIYSNSTIAAAIFGGNSTATNTTFNSTYFLVNSNVALNGTSHTIAGNANFDSNTVFIDALNNRVGVMTGAPNNALTVNGTVFVTGSMTLPQSTTTGNTVNTTGTSQAVIDTFAVASFRSAKYVLSITDTFSAGNYQATEIIMLHDGTNSYVTEYATVRNGSSLGSFASDVSGGNARLLFTPTSNSTTVQYVKTQLVV